LPNDKFGNPFFHASKEGGFFYQQSDDIRDDTDFVDLPDEITKSGNGTFTMKPTGPTDFGVGKNIAKFKDSIGGCDMDFKDTAARGYANKADDPRDIEYKCLCKIDGFKGDNGLSISACTGHHSGGGCCQGFAYMVTMEPTQNPSTFRFRKEMWHVSYHTSPQGEFTHNSVDFQVMGHGWFGYGFCRYNVKDGISKGKDSVMVEVWVNPNPEKEPDKWIKAGSYEDKGDWGDDGNKCGGDKDQVGTWSNAQNRIKTNSTSGTVQFKAVTFREIDPTKELDEEPNSGGGGNTGGGSVQRNLHYCIIRGQDPQDYKGITRTLTEELVESMTDPDPQDTFDNKAFADYKGSTLPEIGDICDDHIPTASQYPSGLWVQPYWSNSDANCVAPGIDEVDKGNSTKVTNPNNNPVFRTPKLYLIFWGQDWKDRILDPTAAGVTDLIQNKLLVTNANYFSKLNQYDNCGIPTFGGLVYNTSTSIGSSKNITQDKAEQALADTFNKGLLDIPKESDENIYFLFIPVGKNIVASDTSQGNIVGYHNAKRFTLTSPTGSSGGGGPITPPSITNFEATLKLQWHINYDDGPQCSPVGLIKGYNNPTVDKDAPLSNSSTWKNQTRAGEKAKSSSSSLRTNTPILSVVIPLKKVGTPASSPTIKCKIWSGNTVKYTSPTTIDPTTLTTSYVDTTFDFSTNTYLMQVGDILGVEYTGTSSTNYVVTGYTIETEGGTSYQVEYENGVWQERASRDFSMVIYK